jgi:ketosteroid isomerase-like protein
MYEAFGRGDVPAIISKLDENVEWDTEVPVDGVPWMEPRRGASNVPGFFEALAPLNFTRFEPHTFFEGGDKVFALVAIEGTNAKGTSFNLPYEGHLWVFNSAGKVVKYQHVTDTALHWRMANA